MVPGRVSRSDGDRGDELWDGSPFPPSHPLGTGGTGGTGLGAGRGTSHHDHNALATVKTALPAHDDPSSRDSLAVDPDYPMVEDGHSPGPDRAPRRSEGRTPIGRRERRGVSMGSSLTSGSLRTGSSSRWTPSSRSGTRTRPPDFPRLPNYTPSPTGGVPPTY